MTCTLCKQDKPKDECTLHYRGKGAHSCDRYKCKACNALLWRVGGILQGNDVLAAKYKDLSPEKKQLFLKENHELMGADLKAAIEQVCEYEQTSTMAYTALGPGAWLDEPDLRDKYKGKPGVADKIVKNTKSFMCPTSERVLYEDMNYQTQSKAENTESIKRRLEISTESKRKGAKQAAQRPKQEPCEDSNGASKPLNEKQFEQLKKMITELEAHNKKLDQYLKVCEVPDIQNGIAPSLICKGKTCLAEIKVHISSMAVIIEEKSCESLQEQMAAFRDAKNDLKEVLKKFSTAIKSASEDVGKKVTFKEDGAFDIAACK